ncbi:MAG: hypothetical protein RL291_1729 [Pseudomonadota bacterium]
MPNTTSNVATRRSGLSHPAPKKVKADGDEARVRASVVAAAQEMSQRGLSPGRTGNVSARWGTGMIITPSGVPYGELTPQSLVIVDGDGTVPAGQLKPSSEWAFHLAAYGARPDRHAMVHTHSMHATVLACAHLPIPAFHYMVAAAGVAEIPCVPYATFGTEALARHVAAGLAKADACLLANHGVVAIGETVQSALELAFSVENLAEQYVKLLSIAKPKILSETEMAVVLERFTRYGQKAQAK